MTRLQRGRAQLSAEGNFRMQHELQGFDASTGPRSIERGRAAGVSNQVNTSRLQRGRAQLSAEGRSSAIWIIRRRSLQRGRAQLSAEGRQRQRRNPECVPASTGPRSIERGRHHILRLTATAYPASTGPRSIERGRAAQDLGLGVKVLASTGPRSIERGRLEMLDAKQAVIRFNGAALN